MISINKTHYCCMNRNVTDFIKLLSCIMIAMHHYSQWRMAAGAGNPFYFLFSSQAGYLGVAIFFFLSGYGLMKSGMKQHLGPVDFFQKRLLKTYLPAVLVSALWASYLVIGKGKVFDWQIIKGVLWYFNDEILWFVRAIVILYGFFYAYAIVRIGIIKYCGRFQDLFNLTVLAITALFAAWCLYGTCGFVGTGSVILFFVGMSWAEFDSIYVKLIRKVYPLFGGFVIIITLAVCFWHDAQWIHLLINNFLILWGITFLTFYEIKIVSFPKWISACSYDIYLVHNKVLMLLLPLYAVVPLLLFTALTIVFTIVFFYIRKIIKL